MDDQKRDISYEDMLKVIHQPEKVIIDVRNPDEVNSTGKIPSSINIPCNLLLPIIQTGHWRFSHWTITISALQFSIQV